MFEKTSYYAAKYINEKKLYTKAEIEKNATEITKTTKTELLDSIMSQESKYLEYEAVKKKKSEEKKKANTKKTNKNNQVYLQAVNKANSRNSLKKKIANRKSKSGFKSVFDNAKAKKK